MFPLLLAALCCSLATSVAATTCVYDAHVLNSAPIHYFSFDDGTLTEPVSDQGTQAATLGGGALVGAWTAPQLQGDAAQQSNGFGAQCCANANSYQFLGAHAVLMEFTAPRSDAVSVEMWLSGADNGRQEVLFAYGVFNSGDDRSANEFLLLLNSVGVMAALRNQYYVLGNAAVKAALLDSQFHHVALTFNVTTLVMHFYVDGILVSSPSAGGSAQLGGTGQLLIGAGADTSTRDVRIQRAFTGLLDAVAFYNYELSSDSIRARTRQCASQPTALPTAEPTVAPVRQVPTNAPTITCAYDDDVLRDAPLHFLRLDATAAPLTAVRDFGQGGGGDGLAQAFGTAFTSAQLSVAAAVTADGYGVACCDGSAMNFDGTQALFIDDALLSNDNVTLELFFRHSTPIDGTAIEMMAVYGDEENAYASVRDEFGIGLRGAGLVAFSSGLIIDCGVPLAAVNDNQWHHLVLTLTDPRGHLRLFVDGALLLQRRTGYNFHFAPRGAFVVGAGALGLTPHPRFQRHYVGDLDNVAMYNSALAAERVSRHFLHCPQPGSPTRLPTSAPTAPTEAPTASPTLLPTEAPQVQPSLAPTFEPNAVPSLAPSAAPVTLAPGSVAVEAVFFAPTLRTVLNDPEAQPCMQRLVAGNVRQVGESVAVASAAPVMALSAVSDTPCVAFGGVGGAPEVLNLRMVLVLRRVNGDWSLVSTLSHPRGCAYPHRFGSDLALSDDGTTLVVGAAEHATTPGRILNASESAGDAFVYIDVQGDWELSDTLVPPRQLFSGDEVGASVCISGNNQLIAVGSANLEGSGDVVVYRQTVRGQYTVIQELSRTLLFGFPSLRGARVGASCALSATGRTLTFGAPFLTLDEFGSVGGVFAATRATADGIGVFTDLVQLPVESLAFVPFFALQTSGRLTAESQSTQLGVDVAVSDDGATIVAGRPGKRSALFQLNEFGLGFLVWQRYGSEAKSGADWQLIVRGQPFQPDIAEGDYDRRALSKAFDGIGSSVAISPDGAEVFVGAPLRFNAGDGQRSSGQALTVVKVLGEWKLGNIHAVEGDTQSAETRRHDVRERHYFHSMGVSRQHVLVGCESCADIVVFERQCLCETVNDGAFDDGFCQLGDVQQVCAPVTAMTATHFAQILRRFNSVVVDNAGTTMVVTGQREPVGLIGDAGALLVFDATGDFNEPFRHRQILHPRQPRVTGWFGLWVRMSGDALVVLSVSFRHVETGAVTISLFARASLDDDFVFQSDFEIDFITSSTRTEQERYALNHDGSLLFIGHPEFNGDVGRVLVYKRDGGDPTQWLPFTPIVGVPLDRSVAPFRFGGSCDPEFKFLCDFAICCPSATPMQLGFAVACDRSGNRAVVLEGNGNGVAAARVYDYNSGTDTWVEHVDPATGYGFRVPNERVFEDDSDISNNDRMRPSLWRVEMSDNGLIFAVAILMTPPENGTEAVNGFVNDANAFVVWEFQTDNTWLGTA